MTDKIVRLTRAIVHHEKQKNPEAGGGLRVLLYSSVDVCTNPKHRQGGRQVTTSHAIGFAKTWEIPVQSLRQPSRCLLKSNRHRAASQGSDVKHFRFGLRAIRFDRLQWPNSTFHPNP